MDIQEIISNPWILYPGMGAMALVSILIYFFAANKAPLEPIVDAEFFYHNATNLTPYQEFCVSLTAVTALERRVQHNVLPFTRWDFLPRKHANYMAIWEVDSKESLINVIEYLFSHGGRGYFFNATGIVEEYLDEDQRIEKIKELYGDNERALRYLQAVSDPELKNYLEKNKFLAFQSDFELGPLAWDVQNIIELTRRSFAEEYITEEESWNIIYQATKMAVDQFNSWDEYARSLAIGVCCSFHGLKSEESYKKRYLEFCLTAMAHEESPWGRFNWSEVKKAIHESEATADS